MVLDELSQASPQVIANAIYMLGNGQGKTRCYASNGGVQVKEALTWELFILSSGEESHEDRIRSAGIEPHAGQQVRLVEIPVSGEDITDWHGFASSAELVNEIKHQTAHCYGIAGLEFVRHLLANLDVFRQELPGLVHKRAQEWCSRLGNCDSQVQRVASRLALCAIAGQLASWWGILPLAEDEVSEACRQLLDRWIEYRGGVGSAEDEKYIRIVTDFIDGHPDAFIKNFRVSGAKAQSLSSTLEASNNMEDMAIRREQQTPRTFAGYVAEGEDGRLAYYFRNKFFKSELFGRSSWKQAARALKERKYLIDYENKKYPYQHPLRVYWLNGNYLQRPHSAWFFCIKLPAEAGCVTYNREIDKANINKAQQIMESNLQDLKFEKYYYLIKHETSNNILELFKLLNNIELIQSDNELVKRIESIKTRIIEEKEALQTTNSSLDYWLRRTQQMINALGDPRLRERFWSELRDHASSMNPLEYYPVAVRTCRTNPYPHLSKIDQQKFAEMEASLDLDHVNY